VYCCAIAFYLYIYIILMQSLLYFLLLCNIIVCYVIYYCCRKNASTGFHCCALLPMCLLVSYEETELSSVYAVGSLIAAVAMSFSAVIRHIPSCLSLASAAFVAIAFIVWMCHAAALDSGNCLLSFSLTLRV